MLQIIHVTRKWFFLFTFGRKKITSLFTRIMILQVNFIYNMISFIIRKWFKNKNK